MSWRSGAFAMRADDFHALSGFDEDYFLYGEDADFSWRARTAGFEILCVPASRIATTASSGSSSASSTPSGFPTSPSPA